MQWLSQGPFSFLDEQNHQPKGLNEEINEENLRKKKKYGKMSKSEKSRTVAHPE